MTLTVKIQIEGHRDDLYALAILFPEGALAGLHVVTEIVGAKHGYMDKVACAEKRQTYVTGDACRSIVGVWSFYESAAVARQIIAPLNGYASLADSNFDHVEPVSAWWTGDHQGGVSFKGKATKPDRFISVDRHELLRRLMPERVAFIAANPLAMHATSLIADPPSWAEYYKLLEDIAGHKGTTLDKLHEQGLATAPALKAFTKAANNLPHGRHGLSKRNTSLQPETLMTLLEAREFVRQVVYAWLDFECGGCLPRDRVDGGSLRFGLDEDEA